MSHDDKVTKLSTRTASLAYSSTPDSYLGTIDAFIEKHSLFDLDDQIENDLELFASQPDEIKLGSLNSFERRNYALAMIADSVMKDAIVEFEVTHADAIVKVMRQHKLPYYAAVQRHIQETKYDGMSEEDQLYITHLTFVLSTCMSAYEFSVRSRFNDFKRRLIVRIDFVAYAFNPPVG